MSSLWPSTASGSDEAEPSSVTGPPIAEAQTTCSSTPASAIGAEQRMATPVGHTAVAGWPEPFPSAPSGFDEIPLAAHNAQARVDYMDSLRIWAMAIYPNVGGFVSTLKEDQ